MLVLVLPPVSSRVKIGGRLARNASCGAPTRLVSSLWFSCRFAVSMGEAAKPLLFECFHAGCQVVLRGRRGTLCRPTCLTMCRNCQNWRTSRAKCWFFCIHVSRLDSLVFLSFCRVYGGSRKTSPFRMFPRRLSCRFAWQAWHFVTFQPV